MQPGSMYPAFTSPKQGKMSNSPAVMSGLVPKSGSKVVSSTINPFLPPGESSSSATDNTSTDAFEMFSDVLAKSAQKKDKKAFAGALVGMFHAEKEAAANKMSAFSSDTNNLFGNKVAPERAWGDNPFTPRSNTSEFGDATPRREYDPNQMPEPSQSASRPKIFAAAFSPAPRIENGTAAVGYTPPPGKTLPQQSPGFLQTPAHGTSASLGTPATPFGITPFAASPHLFGSNKRTSFGQLAKSIGPSPKRTFVRQEPAPDQANRFIGRVVNFDGAFGSIESEQYNKTLEKANVGEDADLAMTSTDVRATLVETACGLKRLALFHVYELYWKNVKAGRAADEGSAMLLSEMRMPRSGQRFEFDVNTDCMAEFLDKYGCQLEVDFKAEKGTEDQVKATEMQFRILYCEPTESEPTASAFCTPEEFFGDNDDLCNMVLKLKSSLTGHVSGDHANKGATSSGKGNVATAGKGPLISAEEFASFEMFLRFHNADYAKRAMFYAAPKEVQTAVLRRGTLDLMGKKGLLQGNIKGTIDAQMAMDIWSPTKMNASKRTASSNIIDAHNTMNANTDNTTWFAALVDKVVDGQRVFLEAEGSSTVDVAAILAKDYHSCEEPPAYIKDIE